MLHISLTNKHRTCCVMDDLPQCPRPSTYKDAIGVETCIVPQKVVYAHPNDQEEPEEENYIDPFADYCGEAFSEFYDELQSYLHDHSLMMLGKSFEILDIIYQCIDVVEVEDESCDESDEYDENEYGDFFEYY